VDHPETIATAIRIGRPARGEQALAAVEESGGTLAAVTDEEILDAYKLAAACEGIMCEPASAASIAGLRKLTREGHDLRDRTVVAVLTGHGLKDPATALSLFGEQETVSPTLEALVARLEVPRA
jgi:threonine synthase